MLDYFSKFDRKTLKLTLSTITMLNVLLFLCLMFFKKYSVNNYSLLLLAFSFFLIVVGFRLYTHKQALISLSQDLSEHINDPDIINLNLTDAEINFFELINFKYRSIFICLTGLIFCTTGISFSAPDQIIICLAFAIFIPVFILFIFIFFHTHTLNRVLNFNLSNDFYITNERFNEIYNCILKIKDRKELE